MVGADGKASVTHRDMVIIFEEVLQEVKEELKKKGQENKFIGARVSFFTLHMALCLSNTHCALQFIYSTIRFLTPEELDWYTEDCIALKKEFPHLIAGMC